MSGLTCGIILCQIGILEFLKMIVSSSMLTSFTVRVKQYAPLCTLSNKCLFHYVPRVLHLNKIILSDVRAITLYSLRENEHSCTSFNTFTANHHLTNKTRTNQRYRICFF